jgi:hypothetical protein
VVSQLLLIDLDAEPRPGQHGHRPSRAVPWNGPDDAGGWSPVQRRLRDRHTKAVSEVDRMEERAIIGLVG